MSNGPGRTALTAMLVASVWIATAAHASAQTAAPVLQPPDAVQRELAATLEKLTRALEAQQKLIEDQSRQIEQLRREVGEAKVRAEGQQPIASARAAPSVAQTPAAGGQAPIAAEHQPRRDREIPPDVVSAGNFPGSIKLPGSD